MPLIILFLMLWVLKSRESEGRLNYCHTFSIALGTHVKRKWVTSQLLLYFLHCLGYSSHEKVEDVSSIIIFLLVLCVLKSRESEGHLKYYNTFYTVRGVNADNWKLMQTNDGAHRQKLNADNLG